MKKRIMIMVLLLCSLLAIACAEQTLESWNAGCAWRMAKDAGVWHMPADALADAEPVLTLPKGSCVRVLTEDGAWLVIDYYAGGAVRSGVVARDAVVTAEGEALPVLDPEPEMIPLATAVPGLRTQPSASSGGSMLLVASSQPEVTAMPAGAASKRPSVTVTVDGGEQTAEVITLGSVTSVVEIDGEEAEVPTALIHCSDEVPDNRQIAAISAPKSGSATLRYAADSRSATVTKLTDGQLVCVLQIGDDFCLVAVGETSGYVTASVLNYDALMSSAEGTGVLCTSSGKTTGSEYINIRVSPKKSATRSYEWPVGTRVTVLSSTKGWYLIELDGCRGYVNGSFLKLDR